MEDARRVTSIGLAPEAEALPVHDAQEASVNRRFERPQREEDQKGLEEF
jgi:hypothetical protein